MAGYIERKLPDGRIGEFPDSMTDEQINQAIDRNFPKRNPIQEFAKNVGKETKRGFYNFATGVGESAQNATNILPRLMEAIGLKDYAPEKGSVDYEKFFGTENSTGIEQLARFAPEVAMAMVIPEMALTGKFGQALSSIPKVGKYAHKAAANAVPQGLFAGTVAEDNPLTSAGIAGGITAPFSIAAKLAQSASPRAKNIAKSIGALGGGALGYGLSQIPGLEVLTPLSTVAGAALGGRGFATKKELMQKIMEGVDVNAAMPRIEAAERLGLTHLTPAEASLNPFTATREGALGRTTEGAKLRYDTSQTRIKSEESAIEKMLDSIYNEKELKIPMEEAYRNVAPIQLPEHLIKNFRNNEVIKSAINQVENRPAFREKLNLKSEPEFNLVGLNEEDAELVKILENIKNGNAGENNVRSSVAYWDHVKKALGDLEESAPKEEAAIIGNIRKDLVKEIDAIVPEYATARSYGERKKTREEMEKAFDRKDVTGANFYRGALASDKKFEKLLHNLRNVPEAQKTLKDMRLLFKDILGTPTIRAAHALERTGMNQERNGPSAFQTLMQNIFTKGDADVDAISFITSKDWHKRLNEIEKITNKQEKAAA